jgi:plastocyanin
MKLRTLGVTVLGTVGLAALPACQKDEAAPTANGPAVKSLAEAQAALKGSEAQPAAEVVTGGGTVSGTVSFKGVPPASAAIEPSMDPACESMALTDQSLQVKDGRLANVLVRVRGLVPSARPARPAVVDQKACTYTPRVQGVAVGQPILLKNSDGTLHNVRGLSGTKSLFNVAQPPNGKAVPRNLPAEAEVVRLKCDIHPWMAAWVVVNPNPYFATSVADGSFAIPNLPAGTYTVEAWHEKLGARTAEVTVKEGESSPLSFVFSPGDIQDTATSSVK